MTAVWTPVSDCGDVNWAPIAGCNSGGAFVTFAMELLTVTALNALPALANAASGDVMLLIVNGQTFAPPDGSFSVAGQTITWTSPAYSLTPGATVVAVYTYAVG